jgi:hypothetical protein
MLIEQEYQIGFGDTDGRTSEMVEKMEANSDYDDKCDEV